jgi:hypothetical protein
LQILTAGLYDVEPHSKSEKLKVSKIIRDAVTFRRPFITKGGYIGLVPELTRIGANVCIFLGAAVPLVVFREARVLKGDKFIRAPGNYNDIFTTTRPRPLEDYTSREDNIEPRSHPLHRIVGQAYAQGIMNYQGDINDDIQQGKIQLEDYFLAT